MLDKTKRYLVVGLGLLGGKYALELTKAGFHVDGINRSEGHLQYALEHGYIASGKTHDFEDLVSSADHMEPGLGKLEGIFAAQQAEAHHEITLRFIQHILPPRLTA